MPRSTPCFIGYALGVLGRVRKMSGGLGSLDAVGRPWILGLVILGCVACQANNPAFDDAAVRTEESSPGAESTSTGTPAKHAQTASGTNASATGGSGVVTGGNPHCGAEHGPCYLMEAQGAQTDSIPDLGGGGAHLREPVKVEFNEHQADTPFDRTLDILGVGGQMRASSVSLPQGGGYGVEVWVRGPRCSDDEDRCGLVNIKDAMAISFRDSGRVYCNIRSVGSTLSIKLPVKPELFKVACWSDGTHARLWLSGHAEVVSFELSTSDASLPSHAERLVVGGPGLGSDDVSHLADGSFALVRVWKKAQDLAAYVQRSQGQ